MHTSLNLNSSKDSKNRSEGLFYGLPCRTTSSLLLYGTGMYILVYFTVLTILRGMIINPTPNFQPDSRKRHPQSLIQISDLPDSRYLSHYISQSITTISITKPDYGSETRFVDNKKRGVQIRQWHSLSRENHTKSINKNHHQNATPIELVTMTHAKGTAGDKAKYSREDFSSAKGQGVAPLPLDHCPGPKNGEIVLKGERHSGTNFIKNIISRNTWRRYNVLDGNSKVYGWKHGFLPPLGGTGVPFNGEKDVLVVVTRDAFSWISKMFENAYDPLLNDRRDLGFSAFIRGEYITSCIDDTGKKAQRFVCESAPNIVQARTRKYKQWLTENPDRSTYAGTKESFLKSRMHVRLESVETIPGDAYVTRQNQMRVIQDQLQNLCIRTKDNNTFKEEIFHLTYSDAENKKGKDINPGKERIMLLQKYSIEDVRFVFSQLDMDFEAKIGYDYNYVLNYQAQEKNNQH